MENKINKEKGFGLIITIFLIMSIVMILTSYLYRETERGYTDFYQSEESRTELMSRLQDELNSFYIAHANDLLQDPLPDYLDEEYIRSNLRIPSRSSAFINIGISDIKQSDKILWRNLYAWMPATDGLDDSAFFPDDDFEFAFLPGTGVAWTGYSGLDYESQRLSSAVKQLENIADNMQNMFVANVNQDFFQDMRINYFAGDCEDMPKYAENLPSINCAPMGEHVPMSSLNVADALGVSNSSLINPWGKEIMLANSSEPSGSTIVFGNNAAGIDSKTPPFSAVLISELPLENEHLHLIVHQIL